jgi:hypothetical protein
MSESSVITESIPICHGGLEIYKQFFCADIEGAILELDMHPEEAISNAFRKHLEVEPFAPALPVIVDSFNPEARDADVRFIDVEPMGHALPGDPDGNTEQRRGAHFMEKFDDRIDPDHPTLVISPHSNDFHRRINPAYEQYEFAMVGPEATVYAVAAAPYLGFDKIVVFDLGWFGFAPGSVMPEQSEAQLDDRVADLHEGIQDVLNATGEELSTVLRDAVRERQVSFWRIVEVMIRNGVQDTAYPFAPTALVLDLVSQSDIVEELEGLTDIAPFEPVELSDEAKAAMKIVDSEQRICGGLPPHQNSSRVDRVLGKARSGARWPILRLRRRIPRRRCLMTFMVPIDNDEIEVESPWVRFPEA